MAADPMPVNLTTVRRLLWLGFAAFILLLVARPVPSLYVDFLWFKEVGYEQVFLTRLGTQIALGLGFGLAFLAFFLINVLIALRRGPTNFVVLHEMKVVMPALEQIRPKLRLAAVLVGVALAVPASQWGVVHWLDWLRYRHLESFGIIDPVFGRDLSFYVFTLPIWQTVVAFVGFSLFITALVTGVAYVVQGRIWARPGFMSVARGARIHLFVLVAVGLLLLAASAMLARFELLSEGRGIVNGAGYADIHGALPGLLIAAVASVLAAVVVMAEAFRRSLRLTIATLITLALVHLALGELWPAAMQRFVVAPSELEREGPYIEREIAATRFAYDLDEVEEGGFPAVETLTAAQVADNAATVENIRLWESDPLKTTNQQLQEIRTYYDFVDVDHDRYTIGGQLKQVALSPRELNPAALPSRTWINEHLTYTHGYGLAVARVSDVSPEGLPVYMVKDIPPVSSVKELEVTEPQIYFGELGAEYTFVGTRSKEFDYPSGDENVYTEYDGDGGIPLGGFLGRLLFAIHFVETKIILSDDLSADSRILIHRRVRERIERVAPFLLWENDPYMIVRQDGSLAWMLDGYTVSDRVPYAFRLGSVGNYVRNPVKAVVDAYHGTIHIYVVDPDDALIRNYASIFPGMFTPLAEMPEDLRAHMRYPEWLFAVQAHVYATYHMTDPQVFYNKEDLWKVANRSDGGRVAPYYTVTKLAGIGEKEEFILMLPFTPARKENMIAWMCARCDPPNYGRLLLFAFPKQRLIYGPQQIESRINQDTEISKELTLWNQQGSEVIRGNLLVIPVDSSLVYFQPLYLRASAERGLPELKRIIVAYSNRIAMQSTMYDALAEVFGVGAVSRPAVAAVGTGEPGPVSTTAQTDEWLVRAAERYDRAQQALRQGDLQAYAREIEALGRILEQARGR
jgi:uncharacterized membrane protein (UPF0182 family)